MENELRFNTSIGSNNPDVNETDNSVSIMYVNKYEFMSDAYYGTGGFRDGNYLIAHQREQFYKKRKELSAYRNFTRPVLDSLITPVFCQEAIRSVQDVNGNAVNGDTLFSTFIENVNNGGNSMQDFSEQVVTYARLHGVTFVVMDNFPADQQPQTIVSAIQGRVMPYMYIRLARYVDDYTIDRYGNLETITFIEQPAVLANGSTEARYMIWTKQYSQVLKKKDKKYVPVQEPVFHGLGVLPVISVYSVKKRHVDEILVDPPMYDIARINNLIYNEDSCIVDQERAQAFSNFYIQTGNDGNLTMGPHNVLFIPMDATISPGYASPDSSILAGLVDNVEKLKESLYQIAQQNGVYGVQEAKSGIALGYEFYATEYQLHKTAKIATNFEQAAAELFRLYTNESFEYVVEYPSDFQPGNSKAIIDTYKIVIDMGIPDRFKKVLYEKMANILLSDEDEAKLAEVIDDIYKEKEEPKQTILPMGGENGDAGAEGIVQYGDSEQ